MFLLLGRDSVTIFDLIGQGPVKGYAVKIASGAWYCLDERDHSVLFSKRKQGCYKFPSVCIETGFDRIVKVKVTYRSSKNYKIEEI